MRARSELRPKQLEVIEQMVESEGVQIILGMGGGKTVSALTAVLDLINARRIRAAIVVAPKRVALSTWPDEIHQWEHLAGLSVGVMGGSPAKRAQVLREKHDVYVCGIDNLPWLLEELKKLPDHPGRDQLIIDELSRFKNPRGSRAKALYRRAGMFGAIWGLTGTPRPNGWEEVWMPLQIVSKGRAWGMPFDPWRERHFMALDFHRRKWSVRPEAIVDLARTVYDWSFVVPPDQTVDVPFVSGPGHDIIVPMDPEARRAAEQMERDLMVQLGLPEDTTIDDVYAMPENVVVALSEAVASGKLSQLMQGYIYDEGEAVHHYDGGKREAIEEFVEDLGGEPLIICYWYAEDLAVLRRIFPDMPHLGAGVSDAKATKIIDDWNAGRVPLLALHPASAGHGLNLQFGGARMLWYAMPWSPELYAQTVKRIARPGQKRPVFVHRMLTDHPYEQIRLRRVEDKIDAEQDFIASLRRGE